MIKDQNQRTNRRRLLKGYAFVLLPGPLLTTAILGAVTAFHSSIRWAGCLAGLCAVAIGIFVVLRVLNSRFTIFDLFWLVGVGVNVALGFRFLPGLKALLGRDIAAIPAAAIAGILPYLLLVLLLAAICRFLLGRPAQ